MSSIPGYQIISSAFNTLCSFEKCQNINAPILSTASVCDTGGIDLRLFHRLALFPPACQYFLVFSALDCAIERGLQGIHQLITFFGGRRNKGFFRTQAHYLSLIHI